MSLQMVHPDSGDLQRPGKSASDAGPHEQCARQPGSGGVGDGVQIAESTLCLGQDPPDQGKHPSDVITGSQLRHYSPVRPVHLRLGMEGMGP